VTETPAAFASALIELLQAGPGTRRGIAACADLSTLSWEHCLARVPTLLAAASKNRRPSGCRPVEA
jgi:hypothetical protein